MKLNYKKIIVLTSLILIIIIAYLKEVNQTKTEIKDTKNRVKTIEA